MFFVYSNKNDKTIIRRLSLLLTAKLNENFNIIIKKFKCYNCDKTDHKTFVCFNKHISDQNSLN